MATTITLPELGEGIESADVIAVLVAPGDELDQDQPVVEVETDKAAVEVPSTAAGTVREVHVQPGQTVEVGAPLVTMETAPPQAAEDPVELESDLPSAGAQDDGASPEKQPESAQEPAVEASPKAPAPSTATEPVAASAAQPAPGDPPTSEAHVLVPAAPAVRRFAREVGVDIAAVPGSGPGGRLTVEDVKAYARRLLSGTAVPASAAPALPDMSRWGEVAVEPMSTIRRVTAEHMARSWAAVPQVTHHDLADITDLEAQRRRLKPRVEAAGGSLTLTAIVVKAVAAGLGAQPRLNASIDVARNQVVLKRYVHIGVAVDTEHGLLVPVIRDADRKSITSIAVELDDLAERARRRALKPDEMQGACFTISNLGGIGGTSFTPIVNWPQVAILGLSRSRMETAWKDGEGRPRLMLPLSLSYDHRLIDGAEAARFTRWLAEALEQPLLLAV